jgi:hypothetical protein
VRGTAFDFDGVNLRVDEGRVYVTGGDGTAVYVGAGHQAVSSPDTGRTAGAVELVKQDLTPLIPPAAAEAIQEPSPQMPKAIDAGVGLEWE